MTKTTDITNLLVDYIFTCGEASTYLQTYYDMNGYVIDKLYNFTKFKTDCLDAKIIKSKIAEKLNLNIDNIGNIDSITSDSLNDLVNVINEAQGIYENDINIIHDYNTEKLRDLIYDRCYDLIISKLDYLEKKDDVNFDASGFVLDYSFELTVLLIIVCVTALLISILAYETYKKRKVVKKQFAAKPQPQPFTNQKQEAPHIEALKLDLKQNQI